MLATLDYLKRKFSEYNEMIFEGRLTEPHFSINRSYTQLGRVRCLRTPSGRGKWHFSQFEFTISGVRDMKEAVLEDTIIHEMIHYWILSNQMQDSSSHGNTFRSKMEEINRRFNRHICISLRGNNISGVEQSKIVRNHLICISRLRDGRLGITIATKSKIFELWDAIQKWDAVAQSKWYISQDTFFNRYRRSTTLKAYIITEEDLNAHRSDFKELIRNGDEIRVKKEA